MFSSPLKLNHLIFMVVFVIAVLTGCATERDVQTTTLPAETPTSVPGVAIDELSATPPEALLAPTITPTLDDQELEGKSLGSIIEAPSRCSISTISPDHVYLSLACSSSIWVARVDGEETPIPLVSGADALSYAESWSPDGKMLALSAPTFPVRLYSTDDWNNPQEIDLGEDYRRIWSGGWSPDSQYLAMTNKEGHAVLSLIKPDGTVRALISRKDNLHHGPKIGTGTTWSPDSTKLAFFLFDNTSDTYVDQLWTMDIASGERSLLYEEEGNNFSSDPSWSPDGRRIAFTMYRQIDSTDDKWRDVVYTYNLDSGELEEVYRPITNSYDFFGSLDGTRLVVVDRLSDSHFVNDSFFEIVSLDTMESTHVPADGIGEILGWTKDGKGILVVTHDEHGWDVIEVVRWD